MVVIRYPHSVLLISNCYLKSKKRNLEFHVVGRPVTPLLVLVDSLNMDLVQFAQRGP